jgi:tetratricopeptide (TPR) repeat protein
MASTPSSRSLDRSNASAHPNSDPCKNALDLYEEAIQKIEQAIQNGHAPSEEEIKAALKAHDEVEKHLESLPRFLWSVSSRMLPFFVPSVRWMLLLLSRRWLQALVAHLAHVIQRIRESLFRLSWHLGGWAIRHRYTTQLKRLEQRVGQSAEQIRWHMPTDTWRELPQSRRQWLHQLKGEEKQPWYERFDWLWRLVTLILITAILSRVLMIGMRFLSNGVDDQLWLLVFPALLTALLGQGLLTHSGHSSIQKILASLHIPEKFWDEALCLFSALFFMLAFFTPLGNLTSWSDWFASKGEENQKLERQGQEREREKHLSRAIAHYERAIKFDADNSQAQFQLGEIYYQQQRWQEAAPRYEAALRNPKELGSSNALRAYDALIHISIHTEKQFSESKQLHQARIWLENCQTLPEGVGVKPQDCDLKQVAMAYLDAGKHKEATNLLMANAGIASKNNRFKNVLLGADNSPTVLGDRPFDEYRHSVQYELLIILARAYLGRDEMNWAKAAATDAIDIQNKVQNKPQESIEIEQLPIPYCLRAQAEQKLTPSKLSNKKFQYWSECRDRIQIGNIKSGVNLEEQQNWQEMALRQLAAYPAEKSGFSNRSSPQGTQFQ